MARLLGCIYAALCTLTVQQVAPIALLHIPPAWGYTLSPTCYWKPRPWTRALGPNPPAHPVETPALRRQVWACEYNRGLKSAVIFGAQLLPTWPTRTTLAKWETENAGRDPLPADWRTAPDPD